MIICIIMRACPIPFSVFGIEPRTLCMLNKHSATVLATVGKLKLHIYSAACSSGRPGIEERSTEELQSWALELVTPASLAVMRPELVCRIA